MARSGATYNRFPQIAAALGPAVRAVIQETILEIETDIKADMAAAKSGALYPRGKTAEHQASAPGESPAVDYGVLIGSIQSQMVRDDLGLVAEGTEYAAALEYGTVRMAPRPHMAPAADRARPRYVQRMRGLEGRLRP